MLMNYSRIVRESYIDGPGLRSGAARGGREEVIQPMKRERSIVNQTTMGEKGTLLNLAI